MAGYTSITENYNYLRYWVFTGLISAKVKAVCFYFPLVIHQNIIIGKKIFMLFLLLPTEAKAAVVAITQ